MKKSSQNKSVNATAFPEHVSVAMAEIAENVEEACWRWPSERGCR
jgi:hypothetical protein